MAIRTTVSAAEFQNNFGRYADAAREAPVAVTRYGRETLVVLSSQEYARMRESYRRVVKLDELAPDEAAELFEALTRPSVTPSARDLDYLMSDVDPVGDVSGKA